MKNSEWRNKAACLGMPTNVFFLERGDSSKEAKTICNTCSVKTDCLNEAVHINPIYDSYGIYGGKSSRERNKIRKQLGLVFTPITHRN
jgi:WhiB family redox-sensing transcriptional regulator